MARGYLQRHLFPYFSRFLPVKHGGEENRSGFKKGEVVLLFSPWWREGNHSDVCIILICWEFNIMPLSTKVFKINRILGDCG